MSPADPIESLLGELLDLPESEWERELGVRCRRHPEHAEALTERFALFARLRSVEPEDEASGLPREFGDFTLMEELGQGGMGVVYRATQRRAGQERTVALKLVRDRGRLLGHAQERLRREGAAAFRLDHPAICPVLDVGEVEGTPYVVMRYVSGRSLAQWIADARTGEGGRELPMPASAESQTHSTLDGLSSGAGSRTDAILLFGEQLASGLQAAHEAGLIHRDVKPANIMVTPDGHPVLLDFGLVRDRDDDSRSLTMTGQPLGTPAYMAPEQIEAGQGPDDIGPSTDVYALGVTLFEALSLRLPFGGEAATREQLYRSILNDPVPDLRRSVPGVDRDLQVVLETAMAKDGAQRYRSARELAEDLRRARLRQPILARPPGLLRRLHLWTRRNRLAAAVLALLLLSQGVIVGLGLRSSRLAEDAQLSAETADRRAAEAVTARDQARAHFTSAREAVRLLGEVTDRHLADVPWLEPVREELQGIVLEFHQEFLASAGQDPSTRLDAAVAELEVGKAMSGLGRDEAADRLASSLTALEALRSEGVEDVDAWYARALALRALLEDRRGDSAEAAASLRLALSTLAASNAAQSEESRAEVAGYGRRLAQVLAQTDPAEARTVVDEALAALGEPESEVGRQAYASLLGLRARLQRDAGASTAAERDFVAASEALELVLEQRPEDRGAINQLANLQLARGQLLNRLGNRPGARDAYQRARLSYQRLVQSFPRVPAYRANLATCLNNLATLLRREGRSEESIPLLRESIAMYAALVEAEPAVVEYRYRLATSRINLGNRFHQSDPARAQEHFLPALESLEQLIEGQPDALAYLRAASSAAANIGTGYAMRERFAEGADFLARAREHSERALALRAEDPRQLRVHARLLYNEGLMLADQGDYESSLQRLLESRDLRRGLATAQGADLRAASDLVLTATWCGLLADVLHHAGEPRLAVWREAESAWGAIHADRRTELEQQEGIRLERARVLLGLSRASFAVRNVDSDTLFIASERISEAIESLERDQQRGFAASRNGELLLCNLALLLSASPRDPEVREPALRGVRAAIQHLDPATAGGPFLRTRLGRALQRYGRWLEEQGEDAQPVLELVAKLRGV